MDKVTLSFDPLLPTTAIASKTSSHSVDRAAVGAHRRPCKVAARNTRVCPLGRLRVRPASEGGTSVVSAPASVLKLWHSGQRLSTRRAEQSTDEPRARSQGFGHRFGNGCHHEVGRSLSNLRISKSRGVPSLVAPVGGVQEPPMTRAHHRKVACLSSEPGAKNSLFGAKKKEIIPVIGEFLQHNAQSVFKRSQSPLESPSCHS